MTMPSAPVPGDAARRVPFDPVRFCAMTTVALLAWAFGPPACVLVMSALGLYAYKRAMNAGLRESRCVLKRPMLVLAYLGLTFTAALVALVRDIAT